MRAPNTTPLLADLRVQAVKDSREEREEETEQYSVLEGLRKYAANHVLLVGRPGSGKSTAIARLLLEESEKARDLLIDHPYHKKIVQIPILVELRYYETSIIDLILQFLKRHDLIIDGSELETILLGKADIDLLLLFDGVNELPSEKGRLDLQRFRNSYGKVSMIFSTRDIGIGGDLNLEKKFEMLPLTELQMKKFVLAYLPEKGEAMLKQLGDRLREFGQTPLLLWMLCSVFESNDSQIPSNLGLVFRQFAEIYDRQLKADVSTFQESREWWRDLLRILAWKMTEGESKTEIKVAISRREAELELTTFVLDQGFPKHYAKKWLEDLLKHHLIQLEGNDQVTFRHQLIQEYYAAEMLLEKISDLSDWELQWNYLNYLKWTEPFALMLGMIEEKDDSIRVIKLALAVDVKLGARLAGEVKNKFEIETVRQILELDVPKPFKTELLGLTKSKSKEVINELGQALINDNDDIRWTALEILCKENMLENMARSLINIGSKGQIKEFLKALLLPLKTSHLKRPSSPLSESRKDELFKISPDVFLINLTELLEDTDDEIRKYAIIGLGKIDSEKTLNILLKTLKDKNEDIRKYSIVGINNNSFISSKIVDLLLESLDDLNNVVRYTSAKILGKFLNCERVISELVKALRHPCKDVRGEVAEALGNISINSVNSKSDLVIYELTKVLEDSNSYVAFAAVQALRRIGTKKAVDSLLKYFENNKQIFGWQKIIKAKLLKIVNFNKQSELVVIELLRFLENYDWDEYWNANWEERSGDYTIHTIHTIQSVVPALAQPVSILDRLLAGKKNDIPSLVKTIENFDVSLRWSAANAVGQIQTEETLQILLNALENPTFATANNGDTFYQAYSAISKIQQKLRYYSPIPEQNNLNNLPPQIPTASPQSVNYYDFRGATVGSFAGIVQGNQQVTQINQKNHDSTT